MNLILEIDMRVTHAGIFLVFALAGRYIKCIEIPHIYFQLLRSQCLSLNHFYYYYDSQISLVFRTIKSVKIEET